MTVAVVVPCFDEAHRLDVDAFVELSERVDRILFVDDGSTDATRAVVEQMVALDPARLSLVVHDRNAGKGEAVRTGLLAAIDDGSTIVGYLDADLATPGSEMVRLIELAERHPELTAVIGSRVALLGHTVRRRPLRHYLGRLYATAASLALREAVYDTQCGAKVFRVGPSLRHALADPFHDRWSFDVELLARLLASDAGADGEPAIRILEVPLNEWTDVGGSTVHPLAGARALWALAGLRSRVERHRERHA